MSERTTDRALAPRDETDIRSHGAADMPRLVQRGHEAIAALLSLAGDAVHLIEEWRELDAAAGTVADRVPQSSQAMNDARFEACHELIGTSAVLQLFSDIGAKLILVCGTGDDRWTLDDLHGRYGLAASSAPNTQAPS